MIYSKEASKTDMKTILVVEDDDSIREVIRFALNVEGYGFLEAGDGGQALKQFQKASIDLVILDIRLPDMLGFEVAMEIRKVSAAPILFITAVEEDLYELKAFEVGGDDFIRKPFSSAALMARVKARLKEPQQDGAQSPASPSVLSYGDVRLDRDSIEARCGEKLISLTAVQFGILETLLSRPEKVFSYDEIMDRAYKDRRIVSKAVIRTHIKDLRRAFRQQGCGDPVKTVTDFRLQNREA